MRIPGIPYHQGRNNYSDRDGMHYGIAIHNTSNTASDEGEASYADHRTDGTSSHFYCLVPSARILYQDLRWRPIGDAAMGDRIIGIDAEPNAGANSRLLVESVVTAVSRRVAECVELELEDGRTVVCTMDHPWLAYRRQSADGRRRSRRSIRPTDRPTSRKGWNWATAAELAAGDSMLAPFRPWDTDDSRTAGYLAALFDGEGCIANAARAMTFAQREGKVLDLGKQMLAEIGIPFTAKASRRNGVTVVVLSGLQANLQFLGSVRPVRFDARRVWLGRSVKSRIYPNSLAITAIRAVGAREVVSIETTSRTFFAEGIASHNCDRDSVTQSLDTNAKAGHAGSGNGNENAIAFEITGTNDKSRQWWLDNVAWDRLGYVIAYILTHDPDFAGFQVRRASVSEMIANPRVKAFYGHDDMRRAWGGTTHTDPGPGFPWDRLFTAVNSALRPTTAAEPTTEESDDMKFLIRFSESPAVFLSDGVTARLVASEGEMADIKTLGAEGLISLKLNPATKDGVRVVGRRELIGRIVGTVPAGFEALAATPSV